MSTMDVINVAASLFSMFLAVFAIWLSFQQRQESQQNYDNTKDVLGEIEKVMEKTELLVSENFQNLLKSITDQQAQMLESLKPRVPFNERMGETFLALAREDPAKVDAVVAAIVKVTEAQAQQRQAAGGDALLQLQQLLQARQQRQ